MKIDENTCRNYQHNDRYSYNTFLISYEFPSSYLDFPLYIQREREDF